MTLTRSAVVLTDRLTLAVIDWLNRIDSSDFITHKYNPPGPAMQELFWNKIYAYFQLSYYSVKTQLNYTDDKDKQLKFAKKTVGPQEGRE